MGFALLDSSVLLDIFTEDPIFFLPSLTCISEVGAFRTLAINGVVYSEISLSYARIEDLDAAIYGTRLHLLEPPREAYFLAARAFYAYKKKGGVKTGVLPDFFIGAHAAVLDIPLITRDPKRVRYSFPQLQIIEP